VFIIPEGGRGVVDRNLGNFIFGKPGVCPGMESGNLLSTSVPIQPVLQQLLKQVVIAKPLVFHVQGDQEKVVLLESGDKLVAIHLALVRLGVQRMQRIAQSRAEPKQAQAPGPAAMTG
jgi:hypothetical protein